MVRAGKFFLIFKQTSNFELQDSISSIRNKSMNTFQLMWQYDNELLSIYLMPAPWNGIVRIFTPHAFLFKLYKYEHFKFTTEKI